MARIYKIVALLLALTAVSAQAAIHVMPVDLKRYMKYLLFDFDTARIDFYSSKSGFSRWIRADCGEKNCHKVSVEVTVHCYDINAKNSYGGYTGYKLMYFVDYNNKIIEHGEYHQGISDYCGQ